MFASLFEYKAWANARMLEAMRALTYTRAGVGQIADDLGFADPA